MVWVWVVVIVVVVGAAVVIAVGRDDAMADVYDDRPDSTIPSGRPLTSDDVDEVRFSTAVRGYRMDEVDAFVARVTADLLARESQALAEASHSGPAPAAPPASVAEPDPAPPAAAHLAPGTPAPEAGAGEDVVPDPTMPPPGRHVGGDR